MAPERRGAPLAGALTSLLVAIALTVVSALNQEIYDNPRNVGLPSATISFLLLAPSLVAYVLSRGTDNAFAVRTLGGVRLLTLASILVAVCGVGLLIDALARQEVSVLDDGLPVLRAVSWAIASILIAGLLLPLGRRWRRRD
jgi:hypothetical protein